MPLMMLRRPTKAHRMFSVVCFLIIGTGLYSGYHSHAAGATYYVATYGNNSYSCAQARDDDTPRRTVNQGVKCLSAGDTLIVKAGTYAERLIRVIPSGSSPSAPVTVKAETPGRVMLRPSGDGVIVQFGSSSKYIVFDGFELDGSNLPPNKEYGAVKIVGVGPYSGASYITLRNLEIRNIYHDSCMAIAGSHHVLSGVKINNCLGNSGTGSHGIYWRARNGIIENTEISNTSGNAIQLYYSNGDGVDNNIVRNSTFRDAMRNGLWVGHGKGNRIDGNEVYNNDRGGVNIRSSGNTIQNNIVCGNGNFQINAVSGNTLSNNVTSC